MKGAKKIVSFILSCLLIVSSFGFFACAKKTDEEIRIVGFEDEVQYAPLGKDYSVQKFLTAVDSNGTPYKGVATVTDGDGNNVALFADMFYVSSEKDYTVNVKVSIPNGENLSRNITLKVVDKFAPVIKTETIAAMIAGRKSYVPEITIVKRIAEDITPVVKVVRKDGLNEVEIPVQDGAFVPDKGGDYEMIITATDQYGTTSERKLDFFVLPENTIEDYSTAAALSNDKQHWEPKSTKELLAEYEGRKGVIKKYLSAGTYRFTSLLSAGYLENLDPEYITVTLWVDLDGEIEIKNGTTSFGKIEGRKWQSFNITIEQLLAASRYGSWEKFCTTHCYGAGGQYLFMLPEAATVYVDEVTIKEFRRPHADMQLEREIGDEIVLKATADVPGEYTIDYSVKDPDGNDVNLSENNSFVPESTGEYVVTATLNHAEYRGTSTFKITVTSPYRVEIGEAENPVAGTPFELPSAKLYDKDGNLVSSDYTVKAYYHDTASTRQEALITNGKVLFHKGDYTVSYSLPYNGKTYTHSLQYTIEGTLAVAAGMLEDYNEPSAGFGYDTDNEKWNPSATKQYVESWYGRQGVIRKTNPDGTFRFRSSMSKEDMAALNATSITISLWVDAEGEISLGCRGTDYGKIQGRTWQEVTITAEQIAGISTYGSWAGFANVHHSAGAGQYLFALSVKAPVYIDYVSYNV